MKHEIPFGNSNQEDGLRLGGGVLQEFLGGDVPLGPRNPLTYTRVKVNSAKPPYPRVTVSPV